MEEYLMSFHDELKEFASEEKDITDQSILLWRMMHHVINEYRKKYPEWVFLRHEDLAADPVEGFKDLYQALGLEFSSSVEKKLSDYTKQEKSSNSYNTHEVKRDSKSQVNLFRERLSDEEIEYIKEKSRDVWVHFYDEEDW
ncbi:MAG: sulfotransferase domain-containing protein [Methanolobus sp.]